MKNYLQLMEYILSNGVEKTDRTGVGTYSVFGETLKYDLEKGFPIITTKKVSFNNIVSELLWFISGSTNIKWLHQYNNTIWDEWASDKGELGKIYGSQWRSTGERNIDQLQNVIEGIRKDPYSRRHIVNSWNVEDLNSMALCPCHYTFQFVVENDKLNCIFNMRSVDVFLGLPYNISSYALLTHIVSSLTDKIPGTLMWVGGDVHLYKNHIEQAKLQLERCPRKLPRLEMNFRDHINDFVVDDFKLVEYDPYPAIKAEVAV